MDTLQHLDTNFLLCPLSLEETEKFFSSLYPEPMIDHLNASLGNTLGDELDGNGVSENFNYENDMNYTNYLCGNSENSISEFLSNSVSRRKNHETSAEKSHFISNNHDNNSESLYHKKPAHKQLTEEPNFLELEISKNNNVLIKQKSFFTPLTTYVNAEWPSVSEKKIDVPEKNIFSQFSTNMVSSSSLSSEKSDEGATLLCLNHDILANEEYSMNSSPNKMTNSVATQTDTHLPEKHPTNIKILEKYITEFNDSKYKKSTVLGGVSDKCSRNLLFTAWQLDQITYDLIEQYPDVNKKSTWQKQKWIEPAKFMKIVDSDKISALTSEILQKIQNTSATSTIEYIWKNNVKVKERFSHIMVDMNQENENFMNFSRCSESKKRKNTNNGVKTTINSLYVLIPFFFAENILEFTCCPDPMAHEVIRISSEPCGTLYIINDNDLYGKHKMEVYKGKFLLEKHMIEKFITGVLDYKFTILNISTEWPKIISYKVTDNFIELGLKKRIASNNNTSLRRIFQENNQKLSGKSFFQSELENSRMGKQEIQFYDRGRTKKKLGLNIIYTTVSFIAEKLIDMEIMSRGSELYENDKIMKSFVFLCTLLHKFNCDFYMLSDIDRKFISAYGFLMRQLSIFNPGYMLEQEHIRTVCRYPGD